MQDEEFDQRVSGLLAALHEASALLAKHGVDGWAAWLSEDGQRIASHDRYGFDHLLMAFGGMGSLSDVVFHPLNGNACGDDVDRWDNTRLDVLRGKLFAEATALRRVLRHS